MFNRRDAQTPGLTPELNDPTGLIVRVSHASKSKALRLEKYIRLSESKGVWGTDDKLLRTNLLVPKGSQNYRVLLAFKNRLAE